jgi:hypothetical protein
LLWNGVPAQWTQTNTTSNDDCVVHIIFHFALPVTAGTTNTLTFQAMNHSNIGHIITNHGQFPSASVGGVSNINILFY